MRFKKSQCWGPTSRDSYLFGQGWDLDISGSILSWVFSIWELQFGGLPHNSPPQGVHIWGVFILMESPSCGGVVSILGFFYSKAGSSPGSGLKKVLGWACRAEVIPRPGPRQRCGCNSSADGKRMSHLNLPPHRPQHPVVAPSTTLHLAASCPPSLGERQGPTSPAVGSSKQLRDAGCTYTLRESPWMRTTTGEGLGLASEVLTSRK